jgi:hypothetical protein
MESKKGYKITGYYIGGRFVSKEVYAKRQRDKLLYEMWEAGYEAGKKDKDNN